MEKKLEKWNQFSLYNYKEESRPLIENKPELFKCQDASTSHRENSLKLQMNNAQMKNSLQKSPQTDVDWNCTRLSCRRNGIYEKDASEAQVRVQTLKYMYMENALRKYEL